MTNTDYHRIVWRENLTDKIEHFRLVTVTYVHIFYTFSAVRLLLQIGEDYKIQFPNRARVLSNDVYFDDAMTAANS